MATAYIQLAIAPIAQMCLNSTLGDVNVFLIQSYSLSFIYWRSNVVTGLFNYFDRYNWYNWKCR